MWKERERGLSMLSLLFLMINDFLHGSLNLVWSPSVTTPPLVLAIFTASKRAGNCSGIARELLGKYHHTIFIAALMYNQGTAEIEDR